MKRKRPLRSPFVVTLGAAALLGGCGGRIDGGGDPPPQPSYHGNPPAQVFADSGADAAWTCDSCNPPVPVCPAQPPSASDTCDLANGSSCDWGGACDATSAVCEDGRWLFASNNPPAPICPATAPVAGDDCSALCLPAGFSCEFSVVDCPFPATWTAACASGVWTVVGTTCNPSSDLDGGEVDASGAGDGGS